MTSHLQNNHRLHLPSTKYMLLPVVQSLNVFIQVTIVLLQRGECREKIRPGRLSVVLMTCVCISPFVELFIDPYYVELYLKIFIPCGKLTLSWS